MEDQAGGTARKKMKLKEFPLDVATKFNIKKIEPWSAHFLSQDEKYLAEFRAALEKARVTVVNIAVDGENSPYAANRADRKLYVDYSQRWIDIAVAIGSPSVRTNIPKATDSAPDADRAAESLLRVVDYAAAKNILVNLENDNPVSEDPFFLVKVIEKVNHPWLHALPDFANTLATGREDYAYTGIAAMFAHAYGICHVKSMEAGEHDKMFTVDMEKTFGILNHAAFKGYCSMEWDSPGDPYQGTSQLIEKTLQYLA